MPEGKAEGVIDPRAKSLPGDRDASRQHRPEAEPGVGQDASRQRPRRRSPSGRCKTGTTNETLDYATYGFLAPPGSQAPGIVVGGGMGNSDHSESRGRGREIISLDGPAPVWHAFMRDYTKSMPVAQFQPPDGLVRAKIDAWTGGRPGSFTRQTTTALFIKGTQPGIKKAVDPPGLMYACARAAAGGST
jgi:membrane carboxypeptidase/penicillin-binding protein